MKTITFIVIVLFLGAAVSAQTPQSFRYQAVAHDNSGNILANQSISFRISILSGSVSGTIAYSEIHTGLSTNVFGLVELEIGKGTPLTGIFSSIEWGNNLYFVKVEMDPNGGTAYQTLSTSQLLSVPYALHSKTVETGDNWGTQVVVSNATLSGSGTTTQPLTIADNAVTSAKILDGTITGAKIAQQSATSGQVLKWNGTVWSPANELWTETNGNIFRNSGKVGIGATNPQAILDVRSKTTLGGIYTESAGGWSFHANSYGSSGVSVAALTDGGTAVNAESPGLAAKLCSTADNAAAYFNGNVFMMGGKVGVGVTNPQAIFDVRSKTTLGGI